MNAKGRVKEDWAFKFYEQDSSLRVCSNPKTDFRSKNGFRVPFGKSKSGFLIW